MGIPMDGYIGYNGSPGNESWEYPWMVILVIMEALGMSLEIPMDGYI